MSPSPAPWNRPFTDKYVVDRVLGRGGMGTVYEARHVRLGQRVAIKVLGDELRVHPELVQRFEREARAASALSSPHAVRVFDIDTTADGAPFFVMEMVTGRDLGNIIEKDGAQPQDRAVRWIIEACDAISEAHQLGIVHRDIKPSNLVLCEATGLVKVLDFGIAKHLDMPGQRSEPALTTNLAPLGTPQYMSPEQVRCAKDIDARSDVWSLGVTLFELLTGRPPFDHDVPQACVAAIVADPVPHPRSFVNLPDGLSAAVMRALTKDVAQRFQTVGELVAALLPYADQLPAPNTTSWKAMPTRRSSNNDVTLGADEFVADLVAGSKSETHAASEEAARPRQDSHETVPPAVSSSDTAVAPTNGRRIRGVLAIAAAAAVGLAALVVTPRWVGSTEEPRTPGATLLQAAPEIAAASATPEPSASVAPPAPAAEPPPPAVVASAPVPSASVKPTRRPPTSSSSVRIIGSERPVHGGLAGPGF